MQHCSEDNASRSSLPFVMKNYFFNAFIVIKVNFCYKSLPLKRKKKNFPWKVRRYEIMSYHTKEYCHHFHQFSSFRKDKKFALPGAPKQYPPDLDFQVKHYCLNLKLDLDQKQIQGTATLTLESTHGKSKRLKLDAIELQIQKVLFEGKELPFQVMDRSLEIELPQLPQTKVPFLLHIDYSAKPRKGLFFQDPDSDHVGQSKQVWSQGQDIDSKWWYPCMDYPNQKASIELKATVHEKYFCLGNGKLLETTKNTDGTKTYHWKQTIPHVNYLVTLVAGEFATLEQKWRGIPVQYYVPITEREKILRIFDKTPEMMEVFSEKIGVPYPYEKYAQVIVQNFVYGGMENTTATTLSDRILVDERAAVDYDWLSLLAHELAHQWWGDLLTCRGWSHAWLNEGFATFFEVVYFEHLYGFAETDYYAYYDLRAEYMGEFQNYSRKLVESEFYDCGELFDRHIYQKGSLVLRMLRDYLGEDLWWKGIRLYVERHAQGFVETDQLRMALEDATGKQLGRFFDQWVYGEGHPKLTVRYTYHDTTKLLELTVLQTQKNQLFSFPLTVDVFCGAQSQPFTVQCEKEENHFFFPIQTTPDAVSVNRRGMLLCELNLDYTEKALIHQLKHATDVMSRIYAAKQLGKTASPKCIEALKIAILEDKFWGVQATCAESLGQLKTPEAFKVLHESRSTPHPKTRLAVAKALGQYPTREAFESLKPLLTSDASYFVEAEAALSIGKTRQEEALPFLMEMLKTKAPSFNSVIQINLLEGLAELKNEKAFDFVKSYVDEKHPLKVRMGALSALTKMFKKFKDKKDLEIFTKLAQSSYFSMRYKVIACLQSLSDPDSLKLLDWIVQNELDGRIRRLARETIHTIREQEQGQDLTKLSTEMEELQQEHKKVLARLATLEAKQTSANS